MRGIAPFLWYGLIFASSCKSVNGKDVERQIKARFKGKKQERLSAIWGKAWWVPVKGWHATEFAILYGLFRHAGWSREASLAWVAGLAAADEVHQTFVPGRTGTPRDVAIDLGGALTAMGIESLIERE